jgi:hypothetical protein
LLVIVPTKTPTGEWINETVATLRQAQMALNELADRIAKLAEGYDGLTSWRLQGLAGEIRAEAARLRQSELPF